MKVKGKVKVKKYCCSWIFTSVCINIWTLIKISRKFLWARWKDRWKGGGRTWQKLYMYVFLIMVWHKKLESTLYEDVSIYQDFTCKQIQRIVVLCFLCLSEWDAIIYGRLCIKYAPLSYVTLWKLGQRGEIIACSKYFVAGKVHVKYERPISFQSKVIYI